MRVLLDIVHPAHALFFHQPILGLQKKGDVVAIASRHKDITTTVLDRLGHDHRPLTTARKGAGAMMFELAWRDVAMLRMVREFRPDVMVGFGGVSISHIGWLLGVPSLSFYDTEIARHQIRVTLPFITEWHVSEAYTGQTPAGRTFRFPGPRQLSFFHPDNFKPDRSRAIAAGLYPDRDNFLLRVVAWRATHDLGKRGWSSAQLVELVTKLSEHGRVHISAEGPLSPELEPYRYRGDVLDLHHLMAFCSAYVGESSTMAAEAAVLGVPSIYAVDDYRGFVEQLISQGLIIRSDGTTNDILRLLGGALDQGPEHWHSLRNKVLAQWINVSDYILAAIERHRPT